MGEAKRRGDFEARKAESEFFAKEQERLDKWLFDNRPIVVSRNTHGQTTRRKSHSSALRRAALITMLSGIGAFVVDK